MVGWSDLKPACLQASTGSVSSALTAQMLHSTPFPASSRPSSMKTVIGRSSTVHVVAQAVSQPQALPQGFSSRFVCKCCCGKSQQSPAIPSNPALSNAMKLLPGSVSSRAAEAIPGLSSCHPASGPSFVVYVQCC